MLESCIVCDGSVKLLRPSRRSGVDASVVLSYAGMVFFICATLIYSSRASAEDTACRVGPNGRVICPVTVVAGHRDHESPPSEIGSESISSTPPHDNPNDAPEHDRPEANSDRTSVKNCSDSTGHPVNILTANKTYPDVDFAGAEEMGLRFDRTYSKLTTKVGALGNNWPSTLDTKLEFHYTDGSMCTFTPGTSSPACSTSSISTINAIRGNGDQYSYQYLPSANGYVTTPIGFSLISYGADGNWHFLTEDLGNEVYLPNGAPSIIQDKYGVGWRFSYNNNFIYQITHSNGRSMAIGWNNNRVATIRDPAGNTYAYYYNNYGFLSKVIAPNGDYEEFAYEINGSPSLLTGVLYNGIRYSRYTYYADGKPQTSGLDGGIEMSSFQWGGTDGITNTVTNALGAVSANTVVTSGFGIGPYYISSITRSGVSGCPNTLTLAHHDGYGHPQSAADAVGNFKNWIYNISGQMLFSHDGTGDNETTHGYAWDSSNRLTTDTRYPAGKVIVQYANGNYYLNPVNPDQVTHYNYVPAGLPGAGRYSSITSTNLTSRGVLNQTRTTTYYYIVQGNGMLSRQIVNGPVDGSQDAIATVYNGTGDIASVGNGFGQTVLYGNYNGLGEPGYVIDANGHETDYQYDARGRVSSVTSLISGVTSVITYRYNARNQVLAITHYPSGIVENRSYDNVGRLIQIDNGSYGDAVNYVYDALSDVLQETTSKYGTVQLTTNYRYDQVGNMVLKIGNNGQQDSYAYDGDNRVIQHVDALGHITRYAYDSMNHVSQITDPSGHISKTAYGSNGKVESVTDYRGLQTTYSYDGLGNLISTQSPDTGLTQYVYNAAGQPTSKQTADGVTTYFSYDGLGRVSALSAQGLIEYFNYDACTYGTGRLCWHSGPGTSATSYTYQFDGQLASQSISQVGADALARSVTYTTQWSYDSLDRVSSITYPDGNIVSYIYDLGSHVSTIGVTTPTSKSGLGQLFASGITYNSYGAMTSMTFRNSDVRSRFYDRDGRLIGLAGGTAQFKLYGYDTANRITTISDQSNSSYSESYGYDEDSRLNSVAGTSSNKSWTFDPNGNRQTAYDAGVQTQYSVSSGSNQVFQAGAESYGYDALGNLTYRSGNTALPNGVANLSVSYDAFNRASSIRGIKTLNGQSIATQGNYLYNALGQRTQKSSILGSRQIGLTDYNYDRGGRLLSESNHLLGSTLPNTDYIWLNGEIVGVIKDDLVYNIFNDHLGRPEVITTGENLHKDVVLWQAYNTAYDRTITTNFFGDFNIGYPGQYLDSESGLYYNLNRYYDPLTGRYTQSDPIGMNGGVNTYAYAGENPITFVDPAGTYCYSAAKIGAISGAVGGAIGGGLTGIALAPAGGIASFFVGAAVGIAPGAASGYLIADSYGSAGASGALNSARSEGFFSAIAGGLAQYEAGKLGLSDTAALGIGGSLQGAIDGAIASGALGAKGGGAGGAIGGLVAGLVATALKAGNDCGCGQ